MTCRHPVSLCIAGVLLGAAMWPALAQRVAGNVIPPALASVRPADGVCHKDDMGPASTAPLPLAPADLACALAPAAARAMADQPGLALVDVRARQEYDAFHIPGALNAGLADLRNKPYWRDKTTILVGGGKGEAELFGLCGQLKRQGYRNVRVVQGGMIGWLGAGGEVTGRAPARAARLSAQEFWAESQAGDNLVLLGTDMLALQARIPFAQKIPGTPAALRSLLEQRRKALGKPLALVIAPGHAMADTELEQLQRSLAPVNVLAYDEARTAFERAFTGQKAVWQALAQGPKRLPCGR